MRQELHPDIEPFIAAIPFEALDESMLPAIRAAKVEVPLSDDVLRTEHAVPGDPPVPVRVHRAKDAEGLLPCVYSIHGGGFSAGGGLGACLALPPRDRGGIPLASRLPDCPMPADRQQTPSSQLDGL